MFRVAKYSVKDSGSIKLGFYKDTTYLSHIIEYSLKFLSSLSDFYSDGNGVFQIEGRKYDSLQISCLGYKSVFLSTNSLKDSIFLVPEVTKLSEVVLSSHKNKKQVVGLKRKNYNFHTNPNLQIGILIKPTNELIGNSIDNIILPINKKQPKKIKISENFTSVFKVNIYSNELGLPKYPILEKPIEIYVTDKTKKSITIDLSENLIDFPKEGIFICIEMIGEINDKGEVVDTNNPRPSFVFTDKQIKEFTSKSYFKTKFNSVWQPMSIETFHLDREIFLAIGLTLSSYD